jgi:hypothetical protein
MDAEAPGPDRVAAAQRRGGGYPVIPARFLLRISNRQPHELKRKSVQGRRVVMRNLNAVSASALMRIEFQTRSLPSYMPF